MPRLSNKKLAAKKVAAAVRKAKKQDKRAPAVSLEHAAAKMNGALDRARNP